MFWTDHNKNSPHIGRAFMDGSSQRVLLSKDVVWPNGLAIDFKGKPKRYYTREFIQTCHRKNKRQMHKGEQNNVFFQQKK